VKELHQRITLTDINDEVPEFTNKPSEFLAAVSSTATANTLIFRLTAVDRDAGSILNVNFTYGKLSQDL